MESIGSERTKTKAMINKRVIKEIIKEMTFNPFFFFSDQGPLTPVMPNVNQTSGGIGGEEMSGTLYLPHTFSTI